MLVRKETETIANDEALQSFCHFSIQINCSFIIDSVIELQFPIPAFVTELQGAKDFGKI